MPTWTQYRAWIGGESSGQPRLMALTADSSGHSTSTLVDTQLKSSISMDNIYDDWWLFAPAASTADDRLRVVASFAASTGTLTVDRVVSGATVYNSLAYELHPLVEPQTDLLDLVNQALKETYVVYDFSFAPAANNRRQDLTANASWLLNPQWVRSVYHLGTDGEQQQTITESGSPGGGTFALSYRGNTTGTIAYNASAATVQSTLRALHGDLAAVTVTRTGTTTDFVWVVTMVGGPVYQPVMTDDSSLLTGGSSPDVAVTITRDMGRLRELDGKAVQERQRVFADFYQTFQTTDRLYVRVAAPAYSLCRSSSTGTFGDRAGLAAEAHEAIPPVEWVGFRALAMAARRMGNNQRLQAAAERHQARWGAEVTRLTHRNFNLRRDAPLTFREVENWGSGLHSHAHGTAWRI